ncbi:MAG: sensor histidine kinase [Chloroflexota bacterium]
MRILIAEDDAVSRLILQRAVQKFGHDCLLAADGAAAWDLFQDNEVDVVISDWMMPGLDGLELCRRVRADQRAGYPYFILLTALSDRSHIFAGLEAGADDYLAKPLDREELQVRLIAATRVTSLYRRLAEEQAARERQYRETERMKSELIALVSHELRTPLTSIKGYVDLVLNGDAGPLSAVQQEFLGIARISANRMVILVNDLLDLSRLESAKIDLRLASVALLSLIQEVVSTFRPQLTAKRQQLTLDLPVSLPPIWADSARITQILTNLLSNAHKYTPAGGEIRISVRAMEETVRLDVSDTGVGMTADDLGQLFTRFFRANNRATREVGGTGLGLVITKMLVELHNGELTVVSTPDKGSTFSATLPIVAAEVAVPGKLVDGGRLTTLL